MKTIDVDFDKGKGLVPVIVQDYKNNKVLMLGYMNKLALNKTMKSKYIHFWSRSRQELWLKGEISGNKLKAKEIFSDCDNDTLLILAELEGQSVCHTGEYSCFFNKLK